MIKVFNIKKIKSHKIQIIRTVFFYLGNIGCKIFGLSFTSRNAAIQNFLICKRRTEQ